MEAPSPILYLALILLLGASAFFSASETAYSAVNKIRLKNLADDGDDRAALALAISEDYDRMLSTILVGNNVVNLSAASIGTVAAVALIGSVSGPALSTIVMTVLVLIFGETLPKSYAKANAEAVALKIARPLHVLQIVLKPIVWFFVRLQRSIKPKDSGDAEPTVTEQELKTIIQNIEEEGVLDEQESDFIQCALDFNETTVQEILIPRVDIVSVDVDDALEDTLETAVSHGYSRLPVYEGSIDNIIGIIYGKDLLEAYVHNKEIDVRALARECLYVYRSKKISELLGEFKLRKIHMAVVTDEYGGTLGLVTMEDILEELVGEIWDESDTVTQNLVRFGDDCYEVQGDLNIEDFFEEIGFYVKDFECGYATVGGWALECLGHIPEEGESFEYNRLGVAVAEMDDQRIVKLRVELRQPAETAGKKK